MSTSSSRPRWVMAVLAAGIFVTALNMRTTIVSFPPMMEIIREDTGLSSSVVGLVMTLPVICFALLSLAAPAVAPFLFGALHDLTGGWTAPTLVVLAMIVPFVWAALGACRPVLVGQGGAVAVVGD